MALETGALRGDPLEVSAAGIDGAAWAEIALNRPEKGNALSMPMIEQLGMLGAAIERDRSLGAVVVPRPGPARQRLLVPRTRTAAH